MPERTRELSGATTAGLLLYTNSALIPASGASSRPSSFMLTWRASGRIRCAAPSRVRFSANAPEVLSVQPPPRRLQSPVTAGSSDTDLSAVPPFSCRVMP